MSKYEALGAFLRAQQTDEVPLSFSEIERITGARLPPSAAKHRPWWSNNANNSVMTRIWLEAGFKTEQVDMASRKLVFRRMTTHAGRPGSSGGRGRHPLFGALRGLVRTMPGTDLTKPADPDWSKRS
jgi:hypothetical protein